MNKSILKDINYIDNDRYNLLHPLCKELVAMLVSSIKTTKSRL